MHTSASPARTASLDAVLFDMDGTLIDTEPYWIEVEGQLVAQHGGSWSEADSLALIGSSMTRMAKAVGARGVPGTPDEIIARVSGLVLERVRERVPWQPGARELLLRLREAGVPTALVTMSPGHLAEFFADEVERSLGRPGFDAVVSFDTAPRPKPEPDPYLESARVLGARITHCIAVEDSVPGATSAISAGCATIAVPGRVPLPSSEALGGHFTRVDTLEGLALDELERVLAHHLDRLSGRTTTTSEGQA